MVFIKIGDILVGGGGLGGCGRAGVDCVGHPEILSDIHNTDLCCVIECYIVDGTPPVCLMLAVLKRSCAARAPY